MRYLIICFSIYHEDKEIIFPRKVQPGAADKSYGIEVARLAGMPRDVLRRAEVILEKFEKKEINLTRRPRRKPAEEIFEEVQRSLF